MLRQVLCWPQDGAPLRLNMWGFNLYTEGHFDLYIADYYDFKVSAAISSAPPTHSQGVGSAGIAPEARSSYGGHAAGGRNR